MVLLRDKATVAARNLSLTAKALECVESVTELREVVATLETCLQFTRMLLYSSQALLIQRSAFDLSKDECGTLFDTVEK